MVGAAVSDGMGEAVDAGNEGDEREVVGRLVVVFIVALKVELEAELGLGRKKMGLSSG